MVFVVAVLAAVLGFVAGFFCARWEQARTVSKPTQPRGVDRRDQPFVPFKGQARPSLLDAAEAFAERSDSPFVQCVFTDGTTKITKRLRRASLTDELMWRGVPYLLTKNGGTIRYYTRKS